MTDSERNALLKFEIMNEHMCELIRADTIDEAFNLLWKHAISKYDDTLCLAELSTDIDTIKDYIQSR